MQRPFNFGDEFLQFRGIGVINEAASDVTKAMSVKRSKAEEKKAKSKQAEQSNKTELCGHTKLPTGCLLLLQTCPLFFLFLFVRSPLRPAVNRTYRRSKFINSSIWSGTQGMIQTVRT
jgi:hypothetical protein